MSSTRLVNTVASVFDLSKTDTEILMILFTKKSGLLISDLTKLLKRSERNIRNRLNSLLEKGLLKRNIEILKNKRLAYRYSIESNTKVVEKTKNHLIKHIRDLNSLLYSKK
jgi:predicted transcriptional regulator